MRFDSLGRKSKLIFTKYYAVVLVIFVLVILLVGYLLFIKNTVSEIKNIGLVDIKNKQAELAASKETLLRLQALKNRYDEITADELAQLAGFLPGQEDIPYLVLKIKKFIEDTGLTLDSLDVGPLTTNMIQKKSDQAASEKSLNKLTISLSIHGLDSYAGLKTFLEELSRNQPLLELTSISYSPGKNSYSLNLSTYYQ
jgi:Tfp pilus assembly protein PilO